MRGLHTAGPSMRYVSTRGGGEALPFQQAVITGLAEDGGLLVPQHLPDVSDRLAEWRGLSYPELALELMSCFIDDIPRAALSSLVQRAYAEFDHPETAPLVSVGDVHILELFHGPTLAFKDMALQFLGVLFDHVLDQRGGRLNVLAATSGDTGSAAIAGVRGKSNVDIAVMFPAGRVSPLQELQMTTVADANVHCLKVQGSFDDCQSLMKSAFADVAFKQRWHLGAMNSVNWARVLAQIVYYAWASLRLDTGSGVTVSVPTGNFGNIFAGYLALRMGLPIRRLVLGTNENDILAEFFNSGVYRRGQVHHTISPSMDIQVASNFERFVYLSLNQDGAAVRRFMAQFNADGENNMPLDTVRAAPISASAIDSAATLAVIRDVHERHRYLLDPHSAVGVAAARQHGIDGPTVCVATAHPAKFPESVEQVVGPGLAVHPRLEALRGLPTRAVPLPATEAAVRGYIEAHLTA